MNNSTINALKRGHLGICLPFEEQAIYRHLGHIRYASPAADLLKERISDSWSHHNLRLLDLKQSPHPKTEWRSIKHLNISLMDTMKIL